MEISEKVAYRKGLAEGLALDTESKEGKLIAAIIDVLDDMSGKFEDLEDELCDVEDGLDAVSDDLCEVEEALYELEDDDEATSPLYEKFSDVLTVSIERSGEHSRFWWIDETDDADLATKLRKLSVDDLELLTLIVQDGYTVVEIAHLHGVAHSTISRKLSRLKKYLKNFSANGTD